MSQINWFPGHMHKARKEIAECMQDIDVVIEVLDARLPKSSENPLVDKLRKNKPVLKLLNKQDLADPVLTHAWLEFYNANPSVQAIAIDKSQKNIIQSIPNYCKKMIPGRTKAGRPVRAMIMGIPNVGKSTLLNAILGKKLAKVGNEPAITRHQQRYSVHQGIALSDTPGILWPKIHHPESGYRLAVSGAVKDTAIEYLDIAAFAASFLISHYPDALKARYNVQELPVDANAFIEQLGRKRGCLRPGGVIDMHKAAEILIQEIRAGKVGAITFESPEEWLEMQTNSEDQEGVN